MKNTLLVLITFVLAFSYSFSDENYDDLVKVNVYSNVKQIQRGSDFYVALKLTVADEWHVYWKNPGDSGLPTDVKWNTPKGVEAVGGLIWQIPERIEWSGMVNYGFGHDVYLLQKFKTTRVSDTKSIDITAEVSWLVCKEKCIPQDDKVSIELAVADDFVKSDNDKMILDLLEMAPKKFESAKSKFETDDEDLEINIVETPADYKSVRDIYLITDGITDNKFKTNIEKNKDEINVQMKLSPYLDTLPAEIEILVIYEDNNGKVKSYETIISN